MNTKSHKSPKTKDWKESLKRITEIRLAEKKQREEAKQDCAKEDPRHEIIENNVTKSNELSRAYYRFNLSEKRVMESMISTLDPRYFNEFKTQDITLKAVDYAKTFNVSKSVAYKELSSATDGLIYRVLVINDNLDTLKIPLMSQARYIESKGEIIASFNPKLIKYLMGLKGKFSTYKLKNAINFKSSYTWRIYEILISWARPSQNDDKLLVGWFELPLDEFKKMVGAPDSYQVVHLKSRIIERAIEELYEKAGIVLNVEYVKKGYSIKLLRFEFIEVKRDEEQLELI